MQPFGPCVPGPWCQGALGSHGLLGHKSLESGALESQGLVSWGLRVKGPWSRGSRGHGSHLVLELCGSDSRNGRGNVWDCWEHTRRSTGKCAGTVQGEIVGM